ncbi:MAG: glycerol-3-phosphate ABC transporter ATP-binding protein [Candidatus Omnitrophica bacterium CG11_big_fil_rev_8_21_14_0_20_41_12]|nr:MAG: glycerol-3-phosphate ABC transporter ATP-binding protein [Candidatus Omnitrophica bacterium CG11_big_fil_rev_8_21_14_0_20_41_12]
MAQVSLDNVCKVFKGDILAVNKINLGIENKEFMVLVGPSGCGKSTTLRMIAGLEDISSGSIYIGNKLVNEVPAKDRDIAMVFQNYALYPHMSVEENMSFGLRLRRMPKQEIAQRVNEAAEILGIKRLFKRKPRELSGGERQRVAVGRAIVRKPTVFLFDEPLSNLDAKMRVQMRTEIHKLHIRLQTTIIYVTHDQVEAMTMGDRIAVMKDGAISQLGDPIDVYDHPRNKFVAGFIGSPPMNFMQGQIIKKEGKLYFDEGKIRVKLVEDMYKKMANYVGLEVIFGIRSENIYDRLFISQAPPENIVKVNCEVFEPIGSEVYLYLNTGRHTFIARVDAHNRPRINQEMDVVFDMSKGHFFDKSTEEAIR